MDVWSRAQSLFTSRWGVLSVDANGAVDLREEHSPHFWSFVADKLPWMDTLYSRARTVGDGSTMVYVRPTTVKTNEFVRAWIRTDAEYLSLRVMSPVSDHVFRSEDLNEDAPIDPELQRLTRAVANAVVAAQMQIGAPVAYAYATSDPRSSPFAVVLKHLRTPTTPWPVVAFVGSTTLRDVLNNPSYARSQRLEWLEDAMNRLRQLASVGIFVPSVGVTCFTVAGSRTHHAFLDHRSTFLNPFAVPTHQRCLEVMMMALLCVSVLCEVEDPPADLLEAMQRRFKKASTKITVEKLCGFVRFDALLSESLVRHALERLETPTASFDPLSPCAMLLGSDTEGLDARMQSMSVATVMQRLAVAVVMSRGIDELLGETETSTRGARSVVPGRSEMGTPRTFAERRRKQPWWEGRQSSRRVRPRRALWTDGDN